MYTKEQTCCFTGHRPNKLPWHYNEKDPRCLALKHRLADALEAAYEENFRHFICGMALGCDFYFCEAVLALRKAHPDVVLEAAIPCPTQSERWQDAEKIRYQKLVDACDLETMVSAHYTSCCMRRRNRYMVDRSNLLMAVFDGMPGGTSYTVQYALGRGLTVVDLPVTIPSK